MYLLCTVVKWEYHSITQTVTHGNIESFVYNTYIQHKNILILDIRTYMQQCSEIVLSFWLVTLHCINFVIPNLKLTLFRLSFFNRQQELEMKHDCLYTYSLQVFYVVIKTDTLLQVASLELMWNSGKLIL